MNWSMFWFGFVFSIVSMAMGEYRFWPRWLGLLLGLFGAAVAIAALWDRRGR